MPAFNCFRLVVAVYFVCMAGNGFGYKLGLRTLGDKTSFQKIHFCIFS